MIEQLVWEVHTIDFERRYAVSAALPGQEPVTYTDCTVSIKLWESWSEQQQEIALVLMYWGVIGHLREEGVEE